MMHYLYLSTNKVNGKAYVGVTKNATQRIKQHKGNSSVIGHAIRKYGADAFAWEILHYTPNKMEAYKDEGWWIAHYDTFNNGYNMTEGGEGGNGTANKGKKYKALSEETRRKMSESRKGTPSGMKGKKLSDERKQQISEFWTGRKRGPTSEEHKRKQSEAMKGKPWSMARRNAQQARTNV